MVNLFKCFRGNMSLPAEGNIENISKEEFQRRVLEIKKCKEDIFYFAEKYFTIITLDKGEQLIKLYPKQRGLLDMFVKETRVITSCTRQCGKTTSYCIYAAWVALFHQDKKILICGNKLETAIEILDKIRLAIELFPMWLKPGIKEWNKTKIEFANGSRITVTSTASSAARGKSANILILDEFAFIEPKLCEMFMSSVMPVVSSVKGTKIFIVSTPFGLGNDFAKIWDRAVLGLDKENGWQPYKIDWWEVPGHDEAWKQAQLIALGSEEKFLQEYANLFIGSSMTLLDGKILKQLQENIKNIPECKKIKLDKSSSIEINVFKPPRKDRCYVLGADVGEGIGGDSSTAICLDVTDITNIETVASFGDNKTSISEFAFILTKMGSMYNNCPLAVECNSIGKGVLEALFSVYEYPNLVNCGSQNDPTKLGILSRNNLKARACIWLKDLMNLFKIKIYEKNLIYELQYFEKKGTSQLLQFSASGNLHDDYVMAFIWAIYTLSPELVENYFIVEQRMKNLFDVEIPIKLQNFQTDYYSDIETSFRNIQINNFSNNDNQQFVGLEGDELIDDKTPISLGFFN